MAKATLENLDSLHDLVAKELSKNLDDPKILAQAITFLRNNNITVDLHESKEVKNIFEVVNNMIDPKRKTNGKDSVDALLEDLV